MAKNKNKTKLKKRSALKQATGSMYPLYYCCEWMHCIVIGGIYVAKKKYVVHWNRLQNQYTRCIIVVKEVSNANM